MASPWSNQIKGLLFISPWLVGLSVFTLLPVGLSIYYSFCDYPLLQPPMGVGLSNFRDMAPDPYFWKTLGNTFYVASLSLPATMLLSLLMAMLLNIRTWGQQYYRTIIFLPSLVPIIAAALLWLALLDPKTGPISNLWRSAWTSSLLSWLLPYLPEKFASPPDWLGKTWVIPMFAFMSLWSIGHTMTIYLASLQDVPRELYEAAELDGASPLRRLIHVTIPMISPVIFFNLIMGIIGSLQNFTLPYAMTGRGDANSTYMYTMYLYDKAFVNLEMGYASAMAWVQLMIILGLTALAFWSAKRWVHYQGR